MKKILTTLALLVATTILLAQAPQKFSYQGVIRDAAGNLVRNAPVGVRVSLLKNSTEGVAVYCETHRQSTNANGLLTLTIGDGTVVGGDMAAIDWADGPYFLKTETDITGGSNYTLVGAQQLLSVPYALYAGSTTNAFSGDYNDLSNKPEIPAAQVNADWKATEGVAEILNKPTKVSDFENDAKYLTNNELVEQLAKMQKQLDSLKAATGNGYSIENDGKPCQGVDTISDIDGNKYSTVQIGKQCWLKENLKTTRYADGTYIDHGSTISKTEAYWYYPNNVSSNKETYGLLYNWVAVMHNSFSSSANPSGVQGVCPTGWHVPSDIEWTHLTHYIGNQVEYFCDANEENIAKSLASNYYWQGVGTSSCTIANTLEGNNATGFSAVPAGNYTGGSDGSNFGYNAHFWSATQVSYEYAYYRLLQSGGSKVVRLNEGKFTGKSVRCLRD